MEQLIDPELALEIIRDESRPIAYDTETDGVEVTSKAIGYVITNQEYSIYVPTDHTGGGNIPNGAEFEAELGAAFADRSRFGYRTVGHNLGFDLRVSRRKNIVLGSPLEDTMINMGLINDLTIGYGLDDCARRYGVTLKLGDELYKLLAEMFGGLPDRKQMANFHRLPGDHPVVVDYATGDGISTLEIWEKQQVELDREELRLPWERECRLLPYLARMHNRGVKIDQEQAIRLLGDGDKIQGELNETIAAAKAKFSPGFNVRSAGDVEGLYRANGYEDKDFKYTAPTLSKPRGQVSFTEKWLETNDIGKEILIVRQLEACASKFLVPMTQAHNINGRLHPVLNQSKSDDYGVSGARLSCSAPNLQAVTKRNEEMGKIVRSVVIADDGMLLGSADFSQQEPRFFTHYSQDPALLEGYRTGTVDIHDRAAAVLGLPRKTAKRLSMGMLTMMYPNTLAVHMNCELPTAKAYHKAFLTDAFPLINQFQRDVISVFEKRGYVKSILGRKARYDGNPRFAYRAVSRVIQNSGGDHMKEGILVANEFEDAYPDAIQILLSIHDSTDFQFDPGQKKVVKELIAALDNIASIAPFNLSVPIPTEFTAGRSWSDASYSPNLKTIHGWQDKEWIDA